MYPHHSPKFRFASVAVCLIAICASLVHLPATFAATRLRPRAATPAAVAPQRANGDPAKYLPTPGTQSKKEPAEAPGKELAEIPIEKIDRNAPAPNLLESQLNPQYTGTTLPGEVEPNGTAATATPIAGTTAHIRGNAYPNADVDFYSFSAATGDRVYAAVMTSFSASASTDSFMDLLASDGTTVIESDNDDGSFSTTSSSIAGATIPSPGTYYIRVRHNSATAQLRPYDLYFQLRSGAPTAETEPNDTFPGQPLPVSGWVSGTTSSTTDVDFYSVNLNAGDTIFLSLDLDPERDTIEWNGQLGLGAFGTPPLILVVNDAGTSTPDSEAYFMTVRDAGTYGIFVGLPTGGTTFGTYHLSATVFPRVSPGSCTTYTSTNVPVTIPTGPGIATSTLTVPGNPRVAKLRVNIDLTHNFMQDLDVELTSPGGTTIGLFTDIGSTTAGSQTTMHTTIDDDAAIPIGQFTVVQGPAFQPELNYRLEWLQGIDAGGTWTLTIRDDAAGDGGTLTGWSLEICEDPQPLCGAGVPTTIYSTDFEANDGGFTHSGTQDEWERGLPTAVPITTANSGVNCWKTDLDNTYNASSSQDLFSPNIVLPAATPIRLSWAQKFQVESASFDHAYVEVREVGGGGLTRRLWEHLGATMTNTVGNPTVSVQEAAGWSLCERDISDFAGLTIQVVFHLDSDTTVQLNGFAVDDVMVQACLAPCVITCPADQMATENPPGSGGAVVNYPAPTTTGNCGAIVCSPASGSTFPVGTTTVTCFENVIGRDGEEQPSGNPGCSFTVTVTQACSGITCPANVTQSNDAGQCGAVVNYPAPTGDPGCGTITCTPASGSFFPIGTTDVTCTSMAGPSCSFTVTVNDTEPPAITCPANITQSNDAGQCGAVVNYVASATDNCPGLTLVCAPASGSFFPTGTTEVTCTATDAANNQATCNFTVTVNDTQAPSIVCPANITTTGNMVGGCGLAAVVNYAAPVVSDNCPGVGAPTCTPPSGSTFPEGTTTVTCTVTDAAGNTSMCTFTVTVTSSGAFGACVVDDFSGDTWSVVTDPASPIYRYWRYHVAATNETFCGTASSMAFYPGRSLTAADRDDPALVMNANLNYGANAGTVSVTDRATGRQFVLRDRNMANDPPCQ